MSDDNTPETETDGGAEAILEGDPNMANGHDPDDAARSTASEFKGEDLVIGYPSGDQPVIGGESVAVAPSEVTALVGPNGSGKSTLLKGLADQLALDDGTVMLDGKDIHALETKELARKLGLLSQENTSTESISVEKLVEHGRYPHRGFFDSMTDEDRQAIDRAISLAGVEHLREREVGSLSGGQKQLVWIAMVLAQETDVLLLDEPTTFLDLHLLSPWPTFTVAFLIPSVAEVVFTVAYIRSVTFAVSAVCGSMMTFRSVDDSELFGIVVMGSMSKPLLAVVSSVVVAVSIVPLASVLVTTIGGTAVSASVVESSLVSDLTRVSVLSVEFPPHPASTVNSITNAVTSVRFEGGDAGHKRLLPRGFCGIVNCDRIRSR